MQWSVSFSAEFGFDVEGVGAVEVDVVVQGRRQVRDRLVSRRVSFCPEGGECVIDLGRVPEHGGVCHEGEAECLVDLVIEVALADISLVGEEHVAAQCVQALALVQLPPHPTPQLLVGDVSARVDRADEPAVFVQRSGEGVLAAAGVDTGALARALRPQAVRPTGRGISEAAGSGNRH